MTRRATVTRFFPLLAICCSIAGRAAAVSYYVHPVIGNDGNPGTNELAPLKTLARADQLNLKAGDAVLLAAGQTFEGGLAFENVSGTASKPVVLSSYEATGAGDDGRALIDAKGFVAGVCLKNCAFVEVANLKITANGGGMSPGQMVPADQRYGVLITATKRGVFAGLTLTHLTVKDIFYEAPGFIRNPRDTRTANGTQSYGWGIRLLTTNSAARMQDIRITDCEIQNVSHTGLQFNGPHNSLRHVEVEKIKVTDPGGPGVQMSGVEEGHFRQLDINGSGSTRDSRNWKRGSGLWTWDCSDVVIEQSRFQNANGPGDSAGVHIDFNCRGVIVQKNFSANNAGGFCEILGNNHNCAYRYNVSVNDGWRTKGLNGAIQEGKTFWLSGYVGGKKPRRGPFDSYFYNNTIYVRSNLPARISIAPTARGVWIANNIFYLAGGSKSVLDDQTRAGATASHAVPDAVFRNNLFCQRDDWPADLPLQDQNPIIGDPGFQKTGGMNLEDYIPANGALVKHRGIIISAIPHDSIGLRGGLKVAQDILGQPVMGLPDLGAIETK